MGKYFGTDGFRGEANETLTVEHAYQIGRFLGWYYAQQRKDKVKVVLGKDTRLSGAMLESALSAGLTASGADVYLLGVTPTPAVAYVTKTGGFAGGIMISASHNPFYDNGIKLINEAGEKMDEETIRQIEVYLDKKASAQPEDASDLPLAKKEAIGTVVEAQAEQKRYEQFLLSLAKEPFNGLRIGLDCANGSASFLAKAVFDSLGAQTFVVNDSPNGVNINNRAGSTHIDVLQEFVKEQQLDVGFAYDGDADRCLAVDEQGNVVDGDLILYICGRYSKEQGTLANDTVVTTVMSNFGLYKAFDEAGIRYEKTAVGDKYVYENMKQFGHSIGGEQSGHVIFGAHATTGDGILTSLKVMEVLLDKKQPLSALAAPVKIYPQVLKNVRVKDKATAQADTDVARAVDAVAEKLGNTGRILVRESGTEPVIRVMVEAETKQQCEEYVDGVISVIRKKGHCVSE